jgi:ubiquitin carboxyl-terminal hydrolase 34
MISHSQENGPIRICRRGVQLLQTFLCNIGDISALPGSQRGLELVHSTVRTFVALLNGIKYETRLISVDDSENDISGGNIISEGGQLMRQILVILKLASQIHQESIVIGCYHLALVVVLHSPEAWIEFRDHADVIHIHQIVLLQLKQSEHIGDIIELVLHRFSASPDLIDGELLDWFWNIVIKLIPIASATTNSSKLLFDLAVSLFRGRYSNKQLDMNDCKDLQKCVQEWAYLLQQHRHYEVVGRDEIDHIARGLSILLIDSFELIPALVEEISANMVHRDIWSGLLFPHPSPTTLPEAYVLEDETRGALYALLNQICKDRKYLRDMVRLIQKVTDLHEPRSWLYDTEAMLRSSTCYVGLRNLRNTCYMNALLQQLFMNVPFRAFMLKVPNNDFDPSKRLLVEVQKLFGFMQNSFAKAYRTGEFTKCMRGIGNTEIDPSIQMDVEEFLNCVFDQWEAQLESHIAKEEFRSFYGGKQVTQTKSKECPHVSVREDPYSVIQCNIHGVSSLEQSLKQYVDGEEMEGANRYKCEQCDEKLVTAVRRSRLHQIPDNIIFHLMRFEYDIATGTRRKLNAYLSFPLRIDMNQYTYDHLVNPEAHQTPDMFELVGVLIHSGEADHGHYISYARVRPTAPGQLPIWLEFDDEYVSYFASECMEEKFFGGQDKRGTMRSHSAYMLFYQRASTLTEDPQSLKTDAAGVLKVQLPTLLKEQIDNKNVDLLRTYCLHQTQHQDFINNLLANLATVHEPDEELHKDRIRVIRVSCQHIWQVFSRKYDVSKFEETINTLQKALGDCIVCNDIAVRILSGTRTASERISRLHDLTLFCPHERVRSSMRSFFIGALYRIRGDRLRYGLDITSDGCTYTRDGSLINLLHLLFEIHPIGLVAYPDAWDDYFGLLSDIAAFGRHEATVMISMGFVELLLRILVIRVSPEVSQEKPFDQLFNFIKDKNPSLDSVIETVYMLLQHIDLGTSINHSTKKMTYYQVEAPSPTVIEFELLMLSKREEIVWLSEALWSWNGEGARTIRKFADTNIPQFTHVAQFVSLLLKDASDFVDMEKIAFTIRRGFDVQAKTVYERGVSSNHLYAAAEFCKTGPISTHTQKMLDAVNQTVRIISTTAAEGFFYFYRELLSLNQDASDDNQDLYLMVLGSADIWGYALLRSQYIWVRNEAHALLMSTLLDESKISLDTTTMRQQRLSVVRSLFREGLCYLESWLLNGTDTDVVPKSNLKQLMNVLTACWTYMLETCTAHAELTNDGDQKLLERFAGMSISSEPSYFSRFNLPTPSHSHCIKMLGMLGNHIVEAQDESDSKTNESSEIDIDDHFTDVSI